MGKSEMTTMRLKNPFEASRPTRLHLPILYASNKEGYEMGREDFWIMFVTREMAYFKSTINFLVSMVVLV